LALTRDDKYRYLTSGCR